MNCGSSAVQMKQLVCKCVCEDIYMWTWVETDPYLAHKQIPELSEMVSVRHLSLSTIQQQQNGGQIIDESGLTNPTKVR